MTHHAYAIRHSISRRELVKFMAAGFAVSALPFKTSALFAEEPDLGSFIRKQAAVFAQNGAPFDPLRIKVGTAFDPYWATTRISFAGGANTKCTFYKVGGAAPFLPLGDTAIPGESPDPNTVGSLLFAPMPGQEDALRHPVRFEYIMDGVGGIGTSNGRDLNYHQPVPPAGYEALGMCFASNNQFPDASQYWCVRRDLLTKIDRRGLWSDAGSHFSNNMDLSTPTLPATEPMPASGDLLLVPSTITPGDRNFPLWAIRLKQLYIRLPSQPAEEEEPIASVHARKDDETRHGMKRIAVVPCSAVNDHSGEQAMESPFYFIVSETYWKCRWSTNIAQNKHDEYSVGFEETQSNSFTEKTALTLSGSVGIAFGPASSSFSSSFSEEFDISSSDSTTKTTDVKRTKDWAIPDGKVSALWEPVKQITVYDSHYARVARILYQSPDADPRMLSAAEK